MFFLFFLGTGFFDAHVGPSKGVGKGASSQGVAIVNLIISLLFFETQSSRGKKKTGRRIEDLGHFWACVFDCFCVKVFVLMFDPQNLDISKSSVGFGRS